MPSPMFLNRKKCIAKSSIKLCSHHLETLRMQMCDGSPHLCKDLEWKMKMH